MKFFAIVTAVLLSAALYASIVLGAPTLSGIEQQPQPNCPDGMCPVPPNGFQPGQGGLQPSPGALGGPVQAQPVLLYRRGLFGRVITRQVWVIQTPRGPRVVW